MRRRPRTMPRSRDRRRRASSEQARRAAAGHPCTGAGGGGRSNRAPQSRAPIGYHRMIHHDKHSRRCERWLGLSWPRALSRIVLSLGCEILGFGLGLSTACGGSTAPVQTDLPTITDSADASGVVQGPPDATSNGDTQSTDAAVPFRGAPDASAYSVDPMEGGSDSHGVSFPLPGNDCVQIRASDYDQTCTSDPECIGVLVGNSCGILAFCNPACPTA